jgi:hypothetical protein
MMKAAGISETSANFNFTVRRNKPEGSHLQTRRSDNFTVTFCCLCRIFMCVVQKAVSRNTY